MKSGLPFLYSRVALIKRGKVALLKPNGLVTLQPIAFCDDESLSLRVCFAIRPTSALGRIRGLRTVHARRLLSSPHRTSPSRARRD